MITLGSRRRSALVEEHWFSRRLHGHEMRAPWNGVDWKADPAWEWHSASDDTPAQLLSRWQDTVDRSRALVTEALADDDMGQLAKHPWPDGSAPSLRWIVCHMIEEYARHNGHADLIRESVDGQVGE